jgi:hypothetical protein
MEFLGPALSIGGALGGLFGGSNDKPQAPPQYQFQNMGGADTASIQGLQNLPQYNAYAQTLPQAGGLAQGVVNNPYAGLYQGLTNSAANTGWNVGGQQTGAGLNLMGAGQGVLPYAGSLLNLGFDPQNALYDRTKQQLTDSTRAGLAARGLNTSPYGAGVENKALSDFDIDWQNNLLSRANQGAQGAGYLLNSGGNAINLGQNVSTLGLNTLTNAAGLPYNAYNAMQLAGLGALGQYGQLGQGAGNQAYQPIQGYLDYLKGGTGATSVANQNYANQNAAQNQQFNQQQTLGKNLGAGLQGLGQAFKGGGFGGYGPITLGGAGGPMPFY